MIGNLYFIGPLGWYHLVVFSLIVPLLAWRSRRRFHAAPAAALSRLRLFQSTAATLVLFGLLSWYTAVEHDLDLFPPVRSPSLAIAIGAAAYAAAVILMRPHWRKAVLERKRVVGLFMPQTIGERTWWVIVSTLAGLSEEITWRGVQTTLLAALVGGVIPAAIVSAIAFGVAHVIQGWRSAAIIALIALAFQLIVAITGTLLVAIAVHAAYDLTAGFAYARLGRELGYDTSDDLELRT